MVPPSKEVRLRSIIRWMKDNNPQAASLPQEELNRIAQEKDDLMMEAFDEEYSNLLTRMSTSKTGYEDRVQATNMGILEAWQAIVADMLPPLATPDTES